MSTRPTAAIALQKNTEINAPTMAKIISEGFGKTIPLGATIQPSGYHAPGDCLMPEYQHVLSSLTPNGGTIVASSRPGARFIAKASSRLNVKWFGAKGDGNNNDTNAIQSAFDAATLTGIAVYLPVGSFSVTDLTFGTLLGTSQQNPSPFYLFGDGATSKLVARSGTGTVLKVISTSYVRLENFWVDCNNVANIGIDSSWLASPAPSQNNFYSFVVVLNYVEKGWVAYQNNDTTFHHCVVHRPHQPGLIAFDIQASGGGITLIECVWFGALSRYSAQVAAFVNCVSSGLECAYADWNLTTFLGGYLYASDITGCCFKTIYCAAVSFQGTHIEVPSGGTHWVIQGKYQAGVIFDSCHIFKTGIDTDPLMFGAVEGNTGAYRPTFSFNNCFLEGIALNTPSEIIPNYFNSFMNGDPIPVTVSFGMIPALATSIKEGAVSIAFPASTHALGVKGDVYFKGNVNDSYFNYSINQDCAINAGTNIGFVYLQNQPDSLHSILNLLSGNVGIGTAYPVSKLHVVGLLEFADNAAALTGGLTVGAFYRTGDNVKVVH